MMKYKFYTTSEKAWLGMLAAIKEAQRLIYWESYIFYPDVDGYETTRKIFDTLIEKARAGVKVKIIADYWGSFFLNNQARTRLEESGAEVLFFRGHRFFGRNHKKILIIDNRLAFIGGVNLAERHRHWLDLHLRLEGAVVGYLLRSFKKSYELSGGRDKIVLPVNQLARWKIKFIEHWPLKRRRAFKRHYKTACWSAQKSIVITTPYFIPHPWLIKILHRAAERGLRVDILLPKKTDWAILNWANYIFASLVYKPGINFYFTNSFIHAKALLIDDREGLVGSQNIDALSFDHNIEGGVAFQQPGMVNQLRQILERWKTEAQLLVFKKEGWRWYSRLLEIIFRLLQPIL